MICRDRQLNQTIAEMFKQGHKPKAIAATIGASQPAVYARLARMRESGSLPAFKTAERPMSARDRQIAELARAGLSAVEIHSRLGGSIKAIYVRLHAIREAGLAPKSELNGHIAIPPSVWTDIVIEAEKRGKQPRDLVRLILRNVVQDNLFAAVLDL